MARIIVNEGGGPRPSELGSDRVLVGGTPDCDVLLTHPAAHGCQLVIERTDTGHRVIALLGQLHLNEQPCDVAHLQHNDTLRIGDAMILYKNPDARLPEPESEPPVAAAAPAAPPPAEAAVETLEELSDLEELQELEELKELTELRELGQLEELTELEELVELEPVVSAARPAADEARAADSADVSAVEKALAELEELLEENAGRAGSVRFTRPLPPGHAAPSGPPPAHPGRPPR